MAIDCKKAQRKLSSTKIIEAKPRSVVTGSQFVKKNNIIHIRIQEGLLLPNGMIDPSTVTWVPVKKNVTKKKWSTLASQNYQLELLKKIDKKSDRYSYVTFIINRMTPDLGQNTIPFIVT
ncbi:hypothetical protein TSAR_008241 [Trichomalopsis sarcophagae]|uniref:Uncharacterized protein n=1 Tax=Trichomalopsis sarcophagae TaxID=543379 RepID=A0A232FA75_9HYME|nr:hypothetical protein TSAR_008241 [Trichomalopsis sarcophagae]